MAPCAADVRCSVQDRSILIVTHSAEIAQLLANIMEAGGYVPDIAAHRDALSRTASVTHPALILLDCDHEAVHDIDALPAARRATLVLFSPSRLADEVRIVAERYALPALAMPTGPRALLQFVRQSISRRDRREADARSAMAREIVEDDVSAA